MFLGLPCHCGWALDELSESIRVCAACDRRYERVSFGWIQVTPKEDIKMVLWCYHRREVGTPCKHCGGTAKER